MKKLLLLLFTSLTLVSCLKDPAEPKPTICITEPTLIGKWEQLSIAENFYNKAGERTKENNVEFKENDEKISRIQFVEPYEDFLKDTTNTKYIAKGEYLASLYDDVEKKVKDIKGTYKLKYMYGATPVEIEADNQSTQYHYEIVTTGQGVILTLTNSVVDDDGMLMETILTFKMKG